MANQPLIFALLGSGGILLISAVTGSSVADVLKGHPGKVSHTGQTLSVAGAASAASTAATGGPGSHGLVTTAALEQIGRSHGWTGQQITDWMHVIQSESNGTLTDTNSSSGAYGIAQFINGPSEYYVYGGNPNTLNGQLTAMANYIAQRYHTPSAAWSFHQANNWY